MQRSGGVLIAQHAAVIADVDQRAAC